MSVRNANLFRLLGAASVSCVFATVSYAADVNGAKKSAPVLEEIIVTAQKREQSLLEVPISVAVVDQDTVSAAQVNDTQSFVQLNPSLSFTRSFAASASSFSMRGISSFVQQGSIQPAVAVIVDGVPLSRSAEFILNLSDVERIEVLRGPQGTLIGKNATAGALNIVTKKPEDSFRVAAEGSYTSDKERVLRATVTGPITDSVRYRLNYFKRDMDGFIKNIHPDVHDMGGIDSEGALGKLDVDLSETMSLRLSADYREIYSEPQFVVIVPDTQLTQEFVDRNGFYPKFDDPKVNDDMISINYDKGWGGSMDFKWELSDSLILRSITAYRDSESDSEAEADLGPESIKPTTVEAVAGSGVTIGFRTFKIGKGKRGRGPIETDTFTQELRLEGAGEKLQYIVGAFFQGYNETAFLSVPVILDLANGPVDAPGPNLLISLVHMTDSDISDDTAAFFGDATFDLSDKLSLFAGARYTKEELDWTITQMDLYDPGSETPAGTALPFFEGTTPEQVRNAIDYIRANPKMYDLNSYSVLPPIILKDAKSEAKVTGRLGLTYQFNDDLSTYLSVNTGFKGAGVNSSATATTADSVLVDAEDAKSIELGMKGRFMDGRLSVNGNIYSMIVEHFQAAQLTPGTFNTEVLNAGDIESRGVELEFAFAATRAITFNGGFAYTDATIQDFTNACYVGQTESQGCNIDSNGDGIGDTQDLTNRPSPIAPKYKWNLAANYRYEFVSLPLNFDTRLAYSWQDKQVFNLQDDPLQTNPSYGLLDLTLTLSDRDDRYAISIFGKNLTDERYYVAYGEIDGFISRSQGMPDRSAFQYWGIKAKVNFF